MDQILEILASLDIGNIFMFAIGFAVLEWMRERYNKHKQDKVDREYEQMIADHNRTMKEKKDEFMERMEEEENSRRKKKGKK